MFRKLAIVFMFCGGCAGTTKQIAPGFIETFPKDESGVVGARYKCEPVSPAQVDKHYGEESETFVIFVCKPHVEVFKNEYEI